MPRFSKKEFCTIAFINHRALSTYIRRKKLILNDNDEIDTSLLINNDFLNSRIEIEKKKVLALAEGPAPKKEDPKTEAAKPPTEKPKKPKKPKVEDPEDENAATVANYNLERYKKQLEIESLENTNKINQIKLDKLNGVVIPTELVMILFGQHSKSITTAFHQAAENFVVEMGQAYGVEKKQQAKMRGDLIAVVNKAIEDSLEISRSGIDNIVDEYAINGK